MRNDWLLGAARHDTAADHIYDAATDLIAKHGFDHLTIDAVARHAHCSRATVYRHTGGVTHLRETVLIRASARITAAVREAVAEPTAPEGIHTALTVALRQARSEAVITAFFSSRHGPRDAAMFAQSPAVNHIASELAGLRSDDPLAASWLIRSILQLLLWPTDPETESQLLQRFLIPIIDPPRPADAGGTPEPASHP